MICDENCLKIFECFAKTSHFILSQCFGYYAFSFCSLVFINIEYLNYLMIHLYLGQKESSFGLKECAFSIVLSLGLVTGTPQLGWAAQASLGPVLPDLAVLISGPPIKDPGALLRYALPIDNKAIREVQKPLEDITDSLKIAGVKALDSVERVSNSYIV